MTDRRPPVRSIVAALLAVLAATGLRSQPADREGCFADCTADLRGSVDLGPRQGTPAPPFAAIRFDPLTGERRALELGSLLDGRPLILAFGSFT